MKKLLTLCLVYQEPNVLLGMKKRGFGEGRWNGFGGKVLPDEPIEDAMQRELKEECGITVQDASKRGVIEFRFQGNEDVLEVHIFKATKFTGEPCETEEMKPQWFQKDKIPFDQMWKDDIYWFPLLLNGKYFTGNFLFDAEENTIITQSLNEVTTL